QAGSQPTSGTIATARNPLWLGGNHPFGEFFDGLIDEARVYDRALSDAEIRADMEKPVGRGAAVRGRANLVAGSRAAPLRAVGLVAAYAFDEGAGVSVADGSGNGNVGTVTGATWTRGRYGSALRFDGAHDLVRVPPSTSLDVGSELTLSAWIRPAASQGGWRTIIYRERDIFFLDAGSDIQGLVGRVDDLLAASVVAAAGCFALVIAASRGRWLGRRRAAWPAAAVMILLGCVVDAVVAPSVTLFGPALLAVWFAVSADDGAEAAVGWLVACALSLVTAASLIDVVGVGTRMQRDDGGLARSAALGVTLVAIGLVMLRRSRPSRRRPIDASHPSRHSLRAFGVFGGRGRVPSIESTSEVLVLLQRDEAVPDHFDRHGRLVHSASSRLFVLDLAPGERASHLMDEPAVRWAGESPPDDVVGELDDAERLFVDGWALRRQGKPERPGEGLDWNAAGRRPPDGPITPPDETR
ncbi:MAG: LamG-like jellyroll fold domain-containing protein, partial [Candidatus Limnocylindrales bacterium]